MREARPAATIVRERPVLEAAGGPLAGPGGSGVRRLGRIAATAAVVLVVTLAAAQVDPPRVAPTPDAVAPAGAAGSPGSAAASADRRELAAAPPGPDLLDRPPGSLPVARADEDGLWLSWALLDTGTGTGPDARWTGSANAATERTEAESTMKAWIAADTLRAAAETGEPITTGEREDIRAAVRSSDDAAAERLYRRAGTDDVLDRLGSECGVEVATSRPGWWSFTQLSALDAAGMLGCVVERAESWPGGADLLGDLRAIDADGRSGVAGLIGAADVSEKNGWTEHGRGAWNVNCVVAWQDRALAVLTSYPAGRGLDHGWGVCRDVAAEVLAEPGV
ncbi:hypothetical protein ACLFMI_13130 [Pseudonocardia nantongensis]|uniref:hypothetical protein n=1 Tax=Pseudonocardia nantongensis TaxID=1181885 RepID=UPI0039793F32